MSEEKYTRNRYGIACPNGATITERDPNATLTDAFRIIDILNEAARYTDARLAELEERLSLPKDIPPHYVYRPADPIKGTNATWTDPNPPATPNSSPSEHPSVTAIKAKWPGVELWGPDRDYHYEWRFSDGSFWGRLRGGWLVGDAKSTTAMGGPISNALSNPPTVPPPGWKPVAPNTQNKVLEVTDEMVEVARKGYNDGWSTLLTTHPNRMRGAIEAVFAGMEEVDTANRFITSSDKHALRIENGLSDDDRVFVVRRKK